MTFSPSGWVNEVGLAFRKKSMKIYEKPDTHKDEEPFVKLMQGNCSSFCRGINIKSASSEEKNKSKGFWGNEWLPWRGKYLWEYEKWVNQAETTWVAFSF